MNKTIMGMAAVALVLALIAWTRGGLPLVQQGLISGGQTLVRMFPLLIVAFAVAAWYRC